MYMFMYKHCTTYQQLSHTILHYTTLHPTSLHYITPRRFENMKHYYLPSVVDDSIFPTQTFFIEVCSVYVCMCYMLTLFYPFYTTLAYTVSHYPLYTHYPLHKHRTTHYALHPLPTTHFTLHTLHRPHKPDFRLWQNPRRVCFIH
jgi:hypothetical protein